ncbi:MAG: putative metalloprotease CJM1_0395 family protein [Magnetovibrio sp.]|nr:putative metalloprotease CJM1_0395 family protein [Magnetovibrio sp.]
MIDTQVRTNYGSLNVSTFGAGRSGRAQARVAEAPAQTPQPTPKVTEGPGFSSYVVSPTTLIAAQEVRVLEAVRREAGESRRSAYGQQELTEEEQQRVQELKKIDREVRAHERAHRAAGGTLTGGAQFTYVRGPDGQQYAVSGEVSIDVSRESSAAATAAKMEAVIRAALAPANPSAQDVAVAAQARQVLNEVSQEAHQERLNLTEGENDNAAQSVRPDVAKANKAYQVQGSQDPQNPVAKTIEDLLLSQTDQGFSLIV